MQCRLQLRREWRPSGRVFMLTRVGLDIHDFRRMPHDIKHMLSDRLRRGECVCGRFRSALHVQLQCGFLILIDHDHRVCG